MNLENEDKSLIQNKTSKKVKVNNYFDTREEKEEIYNTYLKDPLTKMIESIILVNGSFK